MTNTNECNKAGIDAKLVGALARRIERVCRDADKLRITVFMGSYSSLRYKDGGDNALILAHLYVNNCDGGCGASSVHADGYERGE